mgnify:FL=1
MKIENIKPSQDCKLCDNENNYICFDCEEIQIRNKYSNIIYNNDCEWEEV